MVVVYLHIVYTIRTTIPLCVHIRTTMVLISSMCTLSVWGVLCMLCTLSTLCMYSRVSTHSRVSRHVYSILLFYSISIIQDNIVYGCTTHTQSIKSIVYCILPPWKSIYCITIYTVYTIIYPSYKNPAVLLYHHYMHILSLCSVCLLCVRGTLCWYTNYSLCTQTQSIYVYTQQRSISFSVDTAAVSLSYSAVCSISIWSIKLF